MREQESQEHEVRSSTQKGDRAREGNAPRRANNPGDGELDPNKPDMEHPALKNDEEVAQAKRPRPRTRDTL